MAISLVPKSHEPYQNLLDSAVAAQDGHQYKEAVILAQTALELFTEKVLGRLYIARDIVYLKPVFEHLLINYNLVNAKVSGLYVALSGDQIRQEPFWSPLVAHGELRNALVHEGKDASLRQSQASIEAVTSLIEHVTSYNNIA